ncbi:hypothetical protein [Maribacter sp. Asnod1-A12]|uniref:hypothetical protein n=1 Tax=Maribacter sp. Asnod1-A12 TaxID=3160576 RepID=UPI00386A29AE
MIYVFKTSVNTEIEIKELKPYIDKLFPFSKWNFDLEDCDNIFRIEIKESKPHLIILFFKVFDFHCEKLE